MEEESSFSGQGRNGAVLGEPAELPDADNCVTRVHDELHESILKTSEKLKEFQVPLMMSMHASGPSEEATLVDMLKFCDKEHRRKRIYFDLVKYPLPSGGEKVFGSGYKKGLPDGYGSLHKALCASSHESRFSLLCNGSRGSESTNAIKVYHCSYNRTSRTTKGPGSPVPVENSPSAGNRTSISQVAADDSTPTNPNKKVRRRRSFTPILVPKGCPTCKFAFRIGADNLGYYFRAGFGNPTHAAHCKRLKDCHKFRVKAVTGVHISPSRYRHGVGKRRWDDSSSLIHGATDIVDALRQKKCAYCCLSQSAITNNDKEGNTDVSETSLLDVPVEQSEPPGEVNATNLSDCSDDDTVNSDEDEADSSSHSDTDSLSEPEEEEDDDISAYEDGRDSTLRPLADLEDDLSVGDKSGSDDDDVSPPTLLDTTLLNEVSDATTDLSDNIRLPADEKEDMENFAVRHRRKLLVCNDQSLLLAIAYVFPVALRFFKMFGRVVRMDCTSGTNNEGRSLLTCSTNDSQGNKIAFLSAFLPNKRRWVFRWLFLEVFPLLLGREALSRIEVVVTGGDPNETKQLDEAIRKFLLGKLRVHCGWNLVEMGWNRGAPGPGAVRGQKRRDMWTRQIHFVKTWMCSFMKPGWAESKEEYSLSKRMLLEHVKSAKIIHLIGSHHVNSLVEFLRQYFFPHELRFAFHYRLRRRHYDEYRHTIHQGLDSGLKRNETAARPTGSMLTQLHQFKMRLQRIYSKAQTEAIETTMWIQSKTSSHIVARAESALQSQRDAAAKLLVRRVGAVEWRVCLDPKEGERDAKSVNTGIPRFRRTRVVQLSSETGTLCCSCCYFERWGIPCRHHIAVLRDTSLAYGTDLPCGTVDHNDICLVWWKAFVAFFGTQNIPVGMQESFDKLLANDVTGPRMKQYQVAIDSWSLTPCIPEEALPHHFQKGIPAQDRITNYSQSTVDAVYDKYFRRQGGGSTVERTLMQESSTDESDGSDIQAGTFFSDDDSLPSLGLGGGGHFATMKAPLASIAAVLDDNPDPEFMTYFMDLMDECEVMVKRRAAKRAADHVAYNISARGKVRRSNASEGVPDGRRKRGRT